jgi:tRNA(fMet)-specific endonuclease VapC
MRYLLDSNAVIAALSSTDSSLARRLRRQQPSDVCLSSIVAHELFYGAFKSARIEQNIAILNELQFEVLPFDAEDAREAGRIRAALAAKGTPIGPYDVLIAGQSIARNLILITHNTREFRRVPGLQIEDW